MAKQLALVLACSLGIAACGSSSNNATKNASKGYSEALAFSKCMRAHGVSSFPDPRSSGGGIQLSVGPNSGVNPQAPAFQSAQTSCRHLLPGGGPSSGPPSPQALAQLRQVSECMRAHGISGFPDPTTTPPSSPAGYSAVIGRNGVFLAIPNSIDTQSPAFEQASAACNFGPRGAPVPKG
ncbi:MAG: hypothetical protein ACLPZR_32210 [Solirubrobacteraceae bacterium]